MSDDDNRISLDGRCDSPLVVTLRDGECIEGVANPAVTARDDFELAVEWIVSGDCAHPMDADDWLQNIRASRYQELDLANVLSCDSAKLNLGRSDRRKAAAEHKRD